MTTIMSANLKPAKFCAGCGYPIALMFLHKAIEKAGLLKKTAIGLDIGCSLLAWDHLPINTFQTHHGRVTPTMVGYKRAKNDSLCVGITGDGGAYAIGLQNLLHAAKRDEPVTIIVINNTVYAMTGGQSAPTTLKNQKTDTHPAGYDSDHLLGPELLKNIVAPGAYLARTAVNDPKNLSFYLERAIAAQQAGHFSLVEILSFCPTNWRTRGAETLAYLEKLKESFRVGELC